ncbi:MAG TPA: antibiotic ABC transporter ATP-binding protein [Cytophagales bacterium]|nr:antibiotic ABC transporter ATP-binding protein [Cytophagales bacterium]HAA24414.1 antibiotic ABC transporter ATP-binding protein [Cytophagales bacterium]
MRTFFRVLAYSRPYSSYIPQFIVVTALAIIFGLLNLVLVVPLLEVLFDQSGTPTVPEEYQALPSFSVSISWFRWVFYHYFYGFIAEHGKQGALTFVCLLIVASVFLANLFRAGSNLILARTRIQLVRRIRQHLFEHVSTLPLGYFTEQRKGDLLTRMSSDAAEVEFTIVNSLRVYFREPFQIIAYFVLMFALSPTLTLITLITIPISAGLIARVIRSLRKPARQGQNIIGGLMNRTEELLTGMRIVKAFTAERHLQEQFGAENRKLSRVQWRIAKRAELAAPMSEFLNVSVVAVILYVGGRMILNGDSSLEASQFIGFLAIFSQVVRPAKMLSNSLNGLQRGLAAADRMFAMLDETQERITEEGSLPLQQIEQGLEFQNLRFRYHEDLPWVLDGVSFQVPKGQTVALVGPSGAGKSTLIDLIPRFYDPQEGKVLLDGQSSTAYELTQLRGRMAMVTQESILFNDTIFENIAFGKPGATEEEIVAAAKVANAHEFILHTEKGYETVIGDQGTKLSGGQRQRLAIARAVLKNPDILILDEATSALDSESETLVQAALENLLQGRTAVVIAHRLSTIRNADSIVVMDGGRIVETGTHEQLMETPGLYRKMIEMQWQDT